MTEGEAGTEEVRAAKRIHSQLLSLQERVLNHLEEARNDLNAPTTHEIVRDLRRTTGSPVAEQMSRVTRAVEDALRVVQLCQSELQRELVETPEAAGIDGIPNLPPVLRRFLAERAEAPGFEYEVDQDPTRGWVVRWKEYTEQGTVRGCGQFYERPYAWLDD